MPDNKHRALFAVALACIFTWFLSASPVLSQNHEEPIKPSFDLSKGPINITADRLIAGQDTNQAEFSGNVTATSGQTVVTAGALKIWYAPSSANANAGDDQTALPTSQGLERICATQDVKIISQGFISRSDAANYTQTEQKLVLTGNPAVLERGENSVTGTRITLDNNGDLIVEGAVKAVFHPQEESDDKENEKPDDKENEKPDAGENQEPDAGENEKPKQAE